MLGLVQFGGLLLEQVCGGLVALRLMSCGLVGGTGVRVHLFILAGLRKTTGLSFEIEQTIATVVAMVFNFKLNNSMTYRDQRLRGPKLWRGLLLFIVVCGVGAIANIGIAAVLYESSAKRSVPVPIGGVDGTLRRPFESTALDLPS